MSQRFFEDVEVGEQLPEQRHPQTHVQIFRYSAVTYNNHRIHYDKAYAETEGYPDVLTQSHLHGAFLTQLCTDWMGPDGRLSKLSLTVRKFAVPGDVLICRGRVTSAEPGPHGMGTVTLEIEEIRESDGAVCCPGTAEVALPLRSAMHEGAEAVTHGA